MQKEKHRIDKVTKFATSVTMAVFISRILGLVREQVLAYFFGAGLSMDAFVVAYRIPNLLRDLFAEGALASAFVKVFSSIMEKKGKKHAFSTASTLLSNFFIILIITVFIGIIFSPEIVSLIAPDFKQNLYKFSLTVNLTRIMMPFLLLISLSSIFAGMLNSLGIFFLPAVSSGVFNLVSILTCIFGYYILKSSGIEPIYAMAGGVILGGTSQLLFQYPALKKQNFFFKFFPDFKNLYFKEILKLIFPVIFGLSVVQINIFVNTFFATSCGQGAVSWYAYAFRIMYVPLGLFGVGLSQALLPELSRQIARKNYFLAKDTYSRAIIVSLSLSIPSAIGLFILSDPLITTLFQRGRFTPFDTLQTSAILKILALGLPFYSLSKTTVPLFYSIAKTSIPAIGSVIAVITNVLMILLTIKTLGIKGVALGTSFSLLCQSIFLIAAAYLYLKGINLRFILRGFLTLCISGIVLIGILELILNYFSSPFLILLIGIPSGALSFIGVAKILGPEETYLFFKKFLKKS